MAVTAKKAARKTPGRTAAKPARKPTAKPGTAAETRVFRVSLHRRKSIWRDIELRSKDTLYTLAGFAISAFNFDLDHAFGFYPTSSQNMYRAMPRYELFADMGKPTEPGIPGVKTTAIDAVFPQVGHRMTLLFDYGDEWLFNVELTAKSQTEPRARYPRLLRQAGKAPQQYPQFPDDE